MAKNSQSRFGLFKGAWVVLCLGIALAYPLHAQTPEYRFERMWPTLQQPWHFNAAGVTLDVSGNLYVADTYFHRVQKLTSSGVLITKWGTQGAGDGQFFMPKSVAVDGEGSVYIADDGNARIQKFTSSGQFLLKWGMLGAANGEFDRPWSVCVDDADFVYVADANNDRIQKFSSAGEYLGQWGGAGSGNGQLNFPEAVVADHTGHLFVADTFNHRIQKFTTSGVYVTHWGSLGSASGQFNEPSGLALDTEGNVYVADTYNFRLQKFSPAGAFVAQWGAYGFGNGEFVDPRGVCVDASGSVYTVDWFTRIQKFSPSGDFVSRWAAWGIDGDQFLLPYGVTADGVGNVYVADTSNHRIRKYDFNGSLLAEIGSGVLNSPYRVTVDGMGYLYVADTGNNRIVKFTQSGAFVDAWGSPGSGDGQFSAPVGIAVAGNGDVYVADRDNNRIQRFTSSGVFLGKWGAFGTGDGQFSPLGLHPEFDVAVDGEGNVFVADTGNHRIQKFTSNGTFVTRWGDEGTGNGQFYLPVGLAVDNAGNILVAELGERIQVFTSSGTFITKWGSYGDVEGAFFGPGDVAVDGLGNVFVVEAGNHRVQKFKPVTLTSNAKAVVVAGGGPFPGNNLWEATQASANFAYRALSAQGFTKDTIRYLSSDIQLDLDNNGVADDVDADVTAANLQSALTTWAPAQLNGLPTSDVVVYLVDHGGTDAFRLSETEILSSANLASWLDTLQASIQGNVIVVIDSCESGSLLGDLAAPDGYADKRIVMTSTSPGESAYFVTQGVVSFSNYFWTQVFNGETVGECFSQASDALSQNFALQHPLLDDTGDGVSDEADGILAGVTTIGNGTKQYWAGPTIGAVSPAQNLNNTATANLWADPVSDPDGVARVWAVIRPPDYEQEAASNPVTGMPSFDLFPAAQDSPHWEATASIFTTAGTYDVLIYARDRVGNTSAPTVTSVTVTNPLSRKALIVAGGEQTDVLWPSYESVAQTAYNALLYQGYGPEDIYYLSRTGTAGVDGLTVVNNIQHGITTWGVDQTQDFTIYLIGPGTPSAFTVNTTESLPASQLDTWLDTLEAAIPGKVTVLYDGSQSGTFLPILTPPTAGRRIVLASTSTTQNANFLKNGSISFSKFFWGRVLNGATTYDAWSYARAAMKFAGAGQLAQLDDSGDGLFLAMSDGALSRRYLIGSGILLAGDDPIIGSIVPPQNLTGTSTATIWVDDVNTTGTIDRVYAVIVMPNGDTTTVDLTETTPGSYETSFGSFSSFGSFGIAVFATDTAGNISAPKETTVSRLDGPDQYEDDDTFATASWFGVAAPDGLPQTHSFHDNGDSDWVAFDVTDADVTAGSVVVIETSMIGPNAWTMVELYDSDGTTLIDFDDIGLSEPGSGHLDFYPTVAGRYYVKVTNEAGEWGAGAYYDLTISQPIGPCGTRPSLSVVVYNVMGGAALAGIPVQVSSPTAGAITMNTLSSGTALFPSLASGTTYTVSINAAGYTPYSTPLVVGCVSSLPAQYVYLTPTVTPPVLQVTPGQQTASATPGSKNISIANAGSGTLNWTASVLSNSAGFASIAGAASGTGNASVTINLAANETQSTRNAWVKVTAPGAQGSGAEVVVQQSGDTTPPVVTLLGGATVTLNVGQAYLEPGATAADAVSGDRTANIAISGTVNTSMPGTYYLTYQAADIAGNVGSATRTVVIVGETPEGVPVGQWATPLLIVAALLSLLFALRRYRSASHSG